MSEGNPKGKYWRVRRHMRHANQHRPRSFCCYAVDVWIRGEWEQCMGSYKTAAAARKDAGHCYGPEYLERKP